MKFNYDQLETLHAIIGNQEAVKVVAYNKYGKKCSVKARIKELKLNGLVLDYNTLREGCRNDSVVVEAPFWTDLLKENKFMGKTYLREGFFVEKILTTQNSEIFDNDLRTVEQAKKLFKKNSEDEMRHIFDIENDKKYSLYNQFIGDRITIIKNYRDGLKFKEVGVLESATKETNGVELSMFKNNEKDFLFIDPLVDEFYVDHFNGSTSRIYSLASEEETFEK